jgi:tetratricopeptide (TPR) repeat protein
LANQPEAALATLREALDAADPAVAAEAARMAGDLAYQLQDYDGAVELYRRVIEEGQSSSQFPAAVTGRMWADLQAGRNVAVINGFKQFGESLRGEPQAAAKYLAGSAYQNLDQHAPAAELLTRYIAGGDKQPLQALALYKLAVSQFELTRFDDMAETVDRLESRFPGAPQQIDASFLLASADAKQGRAEAGVARLNAFIQDGPENPYFLQALLRRAALLEQEGDPAAAAADLRQYLETSGKPAAESPGVVLRLADLSHRLGEYAAALELTDTLLASDALAAESRQEALYRRGEALTRQQQYREALASFDTLQRDHPVNPYRHAVDLRRGLLLKQLGRAEESMAVLIESADDDRLPTPQRVSALRIIAAHLRDADRPDDTAVTLRRIEQLAGLGVLRDDELLWLGNYEVQRDNPEAALRTLAVIDGQTRRLAGTDESEMLFTRGRAHLQLDDLDKAHRSFFGVVALGRGFDLEARLFLARTEKRRGNYDAALIELSDLVNAADSRIRAEALYETGLVRRDRAELLRRRGQSEDADEQLRAARGAIKRMVLLYLTVDELYPLPPQGLIQLAEIADTLGEPDARNRELEEVGRAFPDSPYAEYARALLSQKQRNRPDDALARLQRLDFNTLDPTLQRWVEDKVDELEALR